MSCFNVENNVSNLSEMTKEQKVVFLQALVCLARADGKFDENEKDFVQEVSIAYGVPFESFEEICSIKDADELVEKVKLITDRHHAMHLVKEMCVLANCDTAVSDEEVLLIGRVGTAMGLEPEKIQQISQWVLDRIIWLEEGKLIFEKVS